MNIVWQKGDCSICGAKDVVVTACVIGWPRLAQLIGGPGKTGYKCKYCFEADPRVNTETGKRYSRLASEVNKHVTRSLHELERSLSDEGGITEDDKKRREIEAVWIAEWFKEGDTSLRTGEDIHTHVRHTIYCKEKDCAHWQEIDLSKLAKFLNEKLSEEVE